MKNIKNELVDLLRNAGERRIFPSYAAGICSYNKSSGKDCLLISGSNKLASGKTEESKKTYYDLASLTKPFATALAIVALVGEGKISLNSKITEYLPPALPEDKREITILQLLNHSSGLPAHRPYFMQLANLPAAIRKEELRRLICSEKLADKPGTAAIYSDLGYLMLGFIIEEVAGVGLEQYFQEQIVGPLGLAEGIFFNPSDRPRKARETFMPTEDCPWRGKVMQGEVSDENCWALGGVAGHAGLFGNIESVLALSCAILEIWQGRREHPRIRRETLACFLEAKSQVAGSTWALGFDRPTQGCSSGGRYLSPRSVGHLGFTGTSFWIDPERDLVIVLLTNRVHPSRDNNRLRAYRPYFHDRVVELLGLDGKESYKLEV